VRTKSTTDAARLTAVFTGLLLTAAVPVALAAGAGSPPAAGLRAEAGSLETRVDTATLELYALETQLGRARSELARLQSQRESLERERASARTQLAAARQSFRASQAQLADLLRALYQQPGHDPLAVLLGADSLDEALAGLDGLNRAARQSSRIVEQARSARERLRTIDARLAARSLELVRLTATANARAASLEATAAERRQFIAGLRERLGVTAARIAAIQADVRRAEARSATITARAPAPAPAAPARTPSPEPAPVETTGPVLAAAPASGTRTLTVSSSGYALQGRTATGIPTAPGVVAVDPSVIPLGTRMSIPGYGIGIAADTGGAVIGNTIDLWFPTTAQALAWGRRTVTITLLQ
jgi:peptidoglycan DL-endopeptidase CwlO